MHPVVYITLSRQIRHFFQNSLQLGSIRTYVHKFIIGTVFGFPETHHSQREKIGWFDNSQAQNLRVITKENTQLETTQKNELIVLSFPQNPSKLVFPSSMVINL